MTNALADPALVRLNMVATPLSEDSSYKLNATFLPVVVRIVLPLLYDDCKVPVPEPIEHLIILWLESIQSAVPLLVSRLSKVTVELAASDVKYPAALFVPPIMVLSIVPPVILTLFDAKLLAVTDPLMDTVSSDEPILMVSASVSSVAMLTVLPPVPVAIFTVFASLPVPRFTAPVVPESTVTAPVVSEVSVISAPAPEVIVPAPAKAISTSDTAIVSREATPVRSPVVVIFRPDDVSANDPVALPTATLPVPAVAILTSDAPVVPRLVAPCEVSVVNTAVDGVVAPMAVLLIPVEVVLKLPAVMSKLFVPVLMED